MSGSLTFRINKSSPDRPGSLDPALQYLWLFPIEDDSISPVFVSFNCWFKDRLGYNSWEPKLINFLFAVLEVQATDQGSPSLSASVLLNINIQDTNDNPPIFPEGNYTVYVQEDKPYGHILLRFSVTDADDSPNGAPFTW